MARTTKQQRDVAAEVTAKIVAQLEAGVAPWVRPWSVDAVPLAMPSNAASKKFYRGANVLLLWAAGDAGGYSDPRWLTFKQAKDLGGSVRKGEKGTHVVFWKFFETDKIDADGEKQRIPMARWYTVFNVEQCDGLEVEPLVKPAQPEPRAFVLEMSKALPLVEAAGASIKHGGDAAAYSPSTDTIRMPHAHKFQDMASYEGTLLHEAAHWTGHEKRLDRKFGKRFGDDAYAMEELVAELGAAFMCASLGVVGKLQHAEYLGHWAKVLRADKNALFSAASQAQKAATLVLDAGRVQDEESEQEAEAA